MSVAAILFRQVGFRRACIWGALVSLTAGWSGASGAATVPAGAIPEGSAAALANAKAGAKTNGKQDGQWHGSVGLSFSYASGNTRSSSLALAADAVRHSDHDKVSLYAQALGSRAESTVNGVVTTTTAANQWKGGARYDRDITETTFGFVAQDFTHDRIQSLGLRSVTSLGTGYHLIHTPETTWDVLGGVTYRDDQYNPPGVVVGKTLRTRFSTAQLLLGEESSSRLTDTTTFKQHLVIMPNLNSDRGALVTFDSSLAVAINESLSLKITVQDRYNSLSQPPIKKNDFLLLTGLNIKFD